MRIRKASGPGHRNDFDMMEIGNGMTVSEDRAHFALWSMMASPLIMGNDLRGASKQTLEILGNKEVIAVNQEPRSAFRPCATSMKTATSTCGPNP